ncbi:MAG: NAD(P)(+) transhydrogenase (Re/Si-specific) subunit beta [Desulfobacula sp.]|uniref:NAD(P)(+) transhydrogenase (Re/Si-specific) subunit beta n=1 Tax=Desulfobacula sp. TaxID=2593537 RepID=UPI0025BCC16A|nr:NAD(P)(+) transhydrogenase (Re/Si-specific) subunit beta [Desulfobacula sp.]MCD4719614.1 NAD(P)(+) transhydrogenase (Re/Si-specific) subunit beta [Desulfobacula sp.]
MTETYSALNLSLDFCVIGILILGIWLFHWPHRAKFGNLTAAFALTCAAGLVLYRSGTLYPYIVVLSLVIGSAVGIWVARKITMIQIPAMVAFQHGAGGVAAFFLSLAELMRGSQHLGMVNEISGLLGLAIGSLTFSGSMIAGGKLSNKLSQTPLMLPKHTWLVMINLIGIIVLIIASVYAPMGSRIFLYILIIFLSILFGIIFSIRIGGADMPVLISFLNATAGVAAAFCGMIIENKLLISCGATVAASGSILTHVMCKAMNRSLFRVFVPVEESLNKPSVEKEQTQVTEPVEKEVKHESIEKNNFEKAVELARKANKIIIVPGYGMAVAQAQFEVIDFSNKMLSMGKDVKFAIHPVAGRMPGHMNVLLAEAGVDYDNLYEMDAVNPEFKDTDFTLVIGACDVVNPAAIETDGSPISGMPILLTHESKNVVCCNLDDKPGYSGVENPLYENNNTLLLLGDAKETIRQLNEALSETPPAIEESSEKSPLDSAITALSSAKKIIIIPGYGMALAQAQFKVVELSLILESMGAQVKFAIHPVAGRMPGHMNVLLAEAEVDYDQLCEMDEINPEFSQTDVVLVFGACDVVNPAAMETEGTPISGMPILMTHDAKKIIICNFDANPGYSGVENTLYENPKTIMMLGDAALTANELIHALKAEN